MSWQEIDGLNFESGTRRFRVDWTYERSRQKPIYRDYGFEALRRARGLAALTGEVAARHGLGVGVAEVRIHDRQTRRWWTISPEGEAAEVLPVVQPYERPPTVHLFSGRR